MSASTTAPQDPADDPTGAPASDRLDPALVKLALVLMLGALASGLDTTIVNVTFDRLEHHFDVSVATVQWVSTAYMLALTMVMPLTGWAISRFGARTAWLACLGTFVVGSMLCGLAWSMPALIAFRVLQGLGGGMMLPLIRVILGRAAGQQRMGRAMVFVAVPGSLSPALGPILGGLVTYSLGWRWAFYINAPLCLAGLVLAWRLLPHGERSPQPSRLDLLGLGLLSGGLAAIVDGLAEAANHDTFTATCAWLPLVIGAVLLVGYTIHALLTKDEPVIDPRLFRARGFTASSILQFLLNATMFGSVLLIPLYYQAGGLDDAKDPAAVLAARLAKLTAARSGGTRPRRRPRYVAGLIPEAIGAMPADMHQTLGELQALIEQRATALASHAIQERQPWTRRLGPPPTDPTQRATWEQQVRTIAAYRDRYTITGPDPLGQAPTSQGQRLDHQRANTAAHRAQATAGEQARRRRDPERQIDTGRDLSR